MDDGGINKELKQKLNFSYCEEEGEHEGQEEARENSEAQSQTPDKSQVQETEAKCTPPRPSLSSTHEVGTFRETDTMSPNQGLRTPVSHSRKCPETPAQPDSRSKLLHCESPFTPKVSKLWRKGDPSPQDLCSFGSADGEGGCVRLFVSGRFASQAMYLNYILIGENEDEFKVPRKQN